MSWELLSSHPASPMEVLHDPLAEERGVQLWVKRDDLLTLPAKGERYPAFCGNKWRKLKYNLLEAHRSGYRQLLSFGGAYSNHIAALAAAGTLFGFHTTGVIRGEPYATLNPTLAFAKACGMELHYLERSQFQQHAKMDWSTAGHPDHGPPYILPEGGTNQLALQGCRELAREIQEQLSPDYVCAACGTGGTLAGLIARLEENIEIWGFPVLKGGVFLTDSIRELLAEEDAKISCSWTLQPDYPFGGYAKWNEELIDFMESFYQQHGILLDQVYTAKLFYGVMDLLRKGAFPRGSVVCMVHSGGLQGLPSK